MPIRSEGWPNGTLPAPAAVRLVQRWGASDVHPRRDLLRFTIAGNVDNGKSTLIGRLLYDTRSISQDQFEALERASRRAGGDGLNLAFLTDGLRAEREQNITIDVAFRYFATSKRSFIISDTPGHIQYTRNLVTGASTAELAVILIDACEGVTTQSRRHGIITALLQIPQVIVGVNKMDLVGYREAVFRQIAAEYREFAAKLHVPHLVFVPISALRGDNIVSRGDAMRWYTGPTLLDYLESVQFGLDRGSIGFRLPVQGIVRPSQDYRGIIGRVVSGTLRAGEEVIVLPSGLKTRVDGVETADGPLEEAMANDSITVRLVDDVDVGRGDMLARLVDRPEVGTRIDATICGLSGGPLSVGRSYVLQHTSRAVSARISRIVHRIDVDTLRMEPVDALDVNDVGDVQIETGEPIVFDPYRRNRCTGAFILVDVFTHATVAAGMIRAKTHTTCEVFHSQGARFEGKHASPNAVWSTIGRPRQVIETRNGHLAAAIWLTGLPGAGKSTIAAATECRLFDAGCRVRILDGDQLRQGLCGDLGFSASDRAENIRRAGEVARVMFEGGDIIICAFISPYRRDRDRVRRRFPPDRFFEIFVACPLDVCRQRDPKGLYARAAAGRIQQLTGLTDPYEPPEAPDLLVQSDRDSLDSIVDQILEHLVGRGIIPASVAFRRQRQDE